MSWPEPSAENRFLAFHVTRLLRSYRELVGRDLLDPALPPDEQARLLYFAPYAVVSHNVAEEPIFNYGNQTALQLFAMTWEEFTALPSRLSAEPLHQPERARLFEQVRAKGYIDDYWAFASPKTDAASGSKTPLCGRCTMKPYNHMGKRPCSPSGVT